MTPDISGGNFLRKSSPPGPPSKPFRRKSLSIPHFGGGGKGSFAKRLGEGFGRDLSLKGPLEQNQGVQNQRAMTMTQKILAAHAGLESVVAGQLIEADLDLVLGNDITSPVAIHEIEK